MTMEPIIELTLFTDPYCVWCWGSEPILRRIQETYGEQISLRYVMGGLAEDTGKMMGGMDEAAVTEFSEALAAHWVEASHKHGMPVNIDFFKDGLPPSTYPANIAFESARIQNPDLAPRYLRRLREAASVECQQIHVPEIQADLAEEVGLDRKRFLTDLEGPARIAFAADQQLCTEYGAQGFPTFLAVAGSEGRMLRGYNRFSAFATAFDSLVKTPLTRLPREFSEPKVIAFIDKYGSATVREVMEVFGVPEEEAETMLERLTSDIMIEARPAGNGTLFKSRNKNFCDPRTGFC